MRVTGTRSMSDDILTLGAALAFYTTLSLAPLVLVVLGVAEFLWADSGARAELERQMGVLLGPTAQDTVRSILDASGTSSGTATIIGVSVLLFGATAAFANLQESLNKIWRVEGRMRSEVRHWLRLRFRSLVMVLFLGLLLLLSVVASTVMRMAAANLPRLAELPMFWSLAQLALSFGVSFTVFGLVFRIVPDARTAWKDVWFGALVTAVLFTLGKELISSYLAWAAIGERYGAAGSFVAFLLWTYYSSSIFYLGAEFTHAQAKGTNPGLA